MIIDPLDIETKEDHPEKLAAVQGMPTKYYINMNLWNAIKNKINQLVDFSKSLKTSLTNSDAEFPTSKAVLAETDKKITKAEKGELAVTSNVNVNNVDPQGKGLLTFSNGITVSGIKATGMYEGQELFILNASAAFLTIQHMNAASSPGNRMFIPSAQDLSLRPNSFVRLRYSVTRTRFELVNVVGTDVFTTLANAGNEQRVVTITPEGVAYAEPIMEYEVFDDTTVGFASLAAVAGVYPTSSGRKKGFQVVCAYMNPPTIYKKTGDGDDQWIKVAYTKMT